MALTELQAALARLYTSGEARAQLRDDPDVFAAAHGLTPAELDSLRQQAAAAIESFAHSLIHKRANEAAHAIPLTRRLFGEEYSSAFYLFAAQGAAQTRDPALDALAFLEWLLSSPGRSLSPGTRQAARYESAWLRVARGGRRLAAGVFDLPALRPGARAHRFVAVWWRWRRASRCRSFQWPRS